MTGTNLTTVDHSVRAHAELSASAAYRWLPCPGSIRMSEGLPDKVSKAAEDGTLAHEVAQLCLESNQSPSDFIGRKVADTWLDMDYFNNREDLVDEWVEDLSLYVDTCRQYMGGDWVYWIERRFTLAVLNPPDHMFGTADFVAFNTVTGELVIIDLKWGQGVVVEAVGNPQLRYYALGALCMMGAEHVVQSISMMIVQPRGRSGAKVKRDSTTPLALIEWSIFLINKAEETKSPNAPLAAGDWCKFCRARGTCPEQAQRALEVAQSEFSVVTSQTVITMPSAKVLTVPELVNIHQKGALLKQFLNDVEDALKELGQSGEDISPLKVVPTQARRKYKADPSQVVEQAGILLDLTEEQMFDRKLKSVAQLEAVYCAVRKQSKVTVKDAKAEYQKLMEGLVSRESSGVTLAFDNDTRDAALPKGSEFTFIAAPT